MSTFAELGLHAEDFEFGRIVRALGGKRVEFDRCVPIGDLVVPLFWVYGADEEVLNTDLSAFESNPSLVTLSAQDDAVHCALRWDARADEFLGGAIDHCGYVMGGRARDDAWSFELCFVDHDELSSFRTHCTKASLPLDVRRITNPCRPDAGAWYGLTERQRSTLLLAVREGYYDIPRSCTTQELAEMVGVSDQAVTERLRRAIVNLVTNTLFLGGGRAD